METTNAGTIENPNSKIENPPTPASPLRKYHLAQSFTATDLDQLPPPTPSLIPDPSSLLASYLPPGQLTLLIAHPNTGKSSLALHLAASLSQGQNPFQSPAAPTPAPNLNPNRNPSPSPAPSSLDHSTLLRHSSFDIHPSETLLLSPSSPQLTLLPRLKRLGANLDKIHFLAHFYSLVSLTKPTKHNPTPLRPLQLVEEFLDSHPNVRLIILDPILPFLGHHASRTDLTDITEPTSLLEKLMQLAHDRHIAILATASLPNLNLADLPASLGKNFLTRTIPNLLLLSEDPRSLPDSVQSAITKSAGQYSATSKSETLKSEISHLKSSPPPSLSPLLLMHLKSPDHPLPTLPLALINGLPTFLPPAERKSPDLSSSSPLSNSQTPKLSNSPDDPYADWYSETTSLTPRDLPSLIRAHRPPSPAIAHAMTFLQSYLEDSGPIPFTKLAKDLRPNAIAESTIRTASRLLGVVKAPNLFQKNWVWHLKEDHRPFPGDPKTNPFTLQSQQRAKEQAFHAQQDQKRLLFAAQLVVPVPPPASRPPRPPQQTRPSQRNASGAQASACNTPKPPQMQSNKPSQPTPIVKTAAQPPRPPIPLGPITP